MLSASHAKPLQGLVVVSIEQAVAAPFCTSRLADAGAEVIKIERPEGDFARGYDDVVRGESSYFIWLNRGKKSVVIDFAAPVGRDVLLGLIGSADVLVQNLKPGALARIGLGPAALRELNPALINCSISGYGETGPLAHRKAYDLLIQAESGLSSITGSPDAAARVGISMVDISTGLTAYAAILEALIARGAGQLGADISVSMFDVMAEWLTVPLLHEEGGRSPKRLGLAHPSIAPYGVFRSSDGGEILISIQSDREWQSLATRLLENSRLAIDPRFATNVARVKNRTATDAVVAEAFRKRTRRQALDVLAAADIAFAEVNDMAALSGHAHLRRIMVDTEVGVVGLPAPAPIVAGVARKYGRVPGLGENQADVFPSTPESSPEVEQGVG